MVIPKSSSSRTSGKNIVLIVVLAVAVFAAGYFLGGGNGGEPERASVESPAGQQADPQEETVWTCSMHPQIQLPDPGQCPICFMDLIPVSKGSGDGGGEAISLRQLHLSPEARKLADVAVQPVVRRSMSQQTRLVGKVDYDETRQGNITAWTGGRIDKLYVDSTGTVVRRGDPMAEIYSPELLTAQAELIQAAKTIRELEGSGLKRVRETARLTEEAAREKLRLLGLTPGQIQAVIERGNPTDHVVLYAPMSGIVIHKNVVEGMYVTTGKEIYAIADLSKVWVVLEAYESDLKWLELGQDVEFQVEAFPGRVFNGEVVYIDPVVSERTRTVNVRLEVDNPGLKLKPGMFVRAVYNQEATDGDDPLIIPASAPLITGKRAVVYVSVPGSEGTFVGREVILGPRVGDSYVVKSGLEEGELVVTKGNFKIDSAIQIQARPSMMNEAAPLAGASAQDSEEGISVDPVFADQLLELDRAVQAIPSAASELGLEGVRAAYATFYQVLVSTDPGSLEGDQALQWNELAMLLGNDAMLGMESDTMEEAGRIYRTMSEHFTLLGQLFELESIREKRSLMATVSTEFKVELAQLFKSYTILQDSLAHDDLEGARAAASDLARILGNVEGEGLSGAAADVWNEASSLMHSGLEAAVRSGSLEGIRQAFQPVSQGLSLAISKLGVMGTPVYELYCPMAFNDQGAAWLQADQEIRNPYFGASMYACGEVRQQLSAGRSRQEERLQVPQASQPGLKEVFTAYVEVQTALASDDPEQARKAFDRLSQAVSSVDIAGPEPLKQAWSMARQELVQGLETVGDSVDIGLMRTGFDAISRGMIALFSTMDVPVGDPVYTLTCPMAFDDQGASWLQRDQEVRNPYFGAAMYACGEVVNQLR